MICELTIFFVERSVSHQSIEEEKGAREGPPGRVGRRGEERIGESCSLQVASQVSTTSVRRPAITMSRATVAIITQSHGRTRDDVPTATDA